MMKLSQVFVIFMKFATRFDQGSRAFFSRLRGEIAKSRLYHVFLTILILLNFNDSFDFALKTCASDHYQRPDSNWLIWSISVFQAVTNR